MIFFIYHYFYLNILFSGSLKSNRPLRWARMPTLQAPAVLLVGWQAHPTAFLYFSGCLKNEIKPRGQ
ncbi:MAG: hypothetical protein IKZ88_03285 [Neisseriaceae bacterium]|nr:hypothetical protein [Neisseriaceae bacterium]